jgi:hypothetical protein
LLLICAALHSTDCIHCVSLLFLLAFPMIIGHYHKPCVERVSLGYISRRTCGYLTSVKAYRLFGSIWNHFSFTNMVNFTLNLFILQMRQGSFDGVTKLGSESQDLHFGPLSPFLSFLANAFFCKDELTQRALMRYLLHPR